jgi:signal transduction histidine kinase
MCDAGSSTARGGEINLDAAFGVVGGGYDGGRMPRGVRRLTVEAVERVRSALTVAWLRDVGPPALVTVVLLAVSRRVEPSEGDRLLDWLAYGLIVVSGGSLMVRRRRPVLVVAVIAVALAVWLGRGYVGGPVFVTLWWALFVLGEMASRRVTFVVATSALGLLVVVGEVADTSPGLVAHALLVGWSATAVLLGDVVRSRREQVAAVEERARQLEQTREEGTRRRLAEERLSIARDLHDTVAHSMTIINVQAGAAARVIDRQPNQAREMLLVIQQASGEVLDELAALLQLLRVDPDEDPSKAPTPGLGNLEELVASARRAGLDVTLSVDDAFGELPRAVSVAAYRIVQESLTNVVRHGGAASATVTLRRDRDGGRLVEIDDDGDGTQPTASRVGTGVGIRGMRERAETTGGRLEAGPRPQGGFRVCATWRAP